MCFGRVYCLIDPRDGAVRYIGATTRQYLCQRLGGHVSGRYKINSPLTQWIRELTDEHDLRPMIEKIYEADSREDLDQKEVMAILLFREAGADLLNIQSGGSVGFECDAAIEKMVLRRKEKNNYGHTEETKTKISIAKSGVKMNPEAHAKMFGRKQSEETVAKRRSKIDQRHEEFGRSEKEKAGIAKMVAAKFEKSYEARGIKCSMDGCEAFAYAKGICKRHYTSQKVREFKQRKREAAALKPAS